MYGFIFEVWDIELASLDRPIHLMDLDLDVPDDPSLLNKKNFDECRKPLDLEYFQVGYDNNSRVNTSNGRSSGSARPFIKCFKFK